MVLSILLALSGWFGRYDVHAAVESSNVKRVPVPVWVEHFTPDLAAPSTEDVAGTGDGIRVLIRDEQTYAGEQTTFRHYAIRFLTQDGVENNSTLSFTFDPAYQSLAFHQLTVHRAGKPLDRLPKQAVKFLQREPNLEDQLYDGRVTATMILEDIRVGDVVEYAFSIHGRNPILGSHFAETFSSAWHDPLPKWRERLLWPSNRPLPDIQCHGSPSNPQVRLLDHGKTTEFRWEGDALPGHRSESETPSWVDAYGWIQVSDFSSWQDVARWSAKLFDQAGIDPQKPLPAELDREVTALHAIPDRAAQIVAALRYVQDNYRYLGMEIGENSHQPYPVAVVCDRRFGDCKDKANLLSTLLRRLGFEADPALVETDYRRTIGDWHPTPYAFDHAVVHLRYEGATYWLDPTRSHQGGSLGHLYFPDYGKALVVREDTDGLEDIHPGAFEDAGYEVTSLYKQEQYSGPTRLTVHTTLRGLNADRTRGYFARTNREQIERDYLNFYAKQHPKIRSLAKVDFNDDRDRNQVNVVERYEVDDLWGKDNDPAAKKLRAYFHPGEIKACFHLPSTRLRTMPFALSYPERITQTTLISLPGKTKITPEKMEVKDPAFDFNYSSRMENGSGTIILTYRYQSKTDSVPVEGLADYLTHVDRAVDELGYTISIGRSLLNSTPASPQTEPATMPAPEKAAAPPPIWLALVPFAVSGVVFGGIGLGVLYRRRRNGARRPVLPPPLPLHRCGICGRTEIGFPALDFRVGSDGQDYCTDHLGRSGGATPLGTALPVHGPI